MVKETMSIHVFPHDLRNKRDHIHISTLFQAKYGTRSMAALAAKLDGEVTFYERYLENSLWKEKLIQFQMEKA
jgi:uncharacterized protein with NRDE domain